MTNEAQGSRFVVDLGDIKLSGILERQVEAEIQAVVLRAVASLGSQLSATARSSSIWDKFPGQTLGLWPGYPERRPPGFPFGEIQPLSVRDHTIIMKAIMDHPMQVVRYLPQKYKVSPGARPSGTEVLEATLKVEQIDEYVKERIRAVLEVLPKIEDNQAALPESAKKALDDLRQRIAQQNPEEKSRAFRDPGLRARYRDEGLSEGMEIAARILEDGQDSIYSPDHSFYKLLQEGKGSSRSAAREVLSDMADLDGVGAAAGGAVGSFFGGIGAAPGAVAAGAGASAGAAIGHAIVWLFDW